MIWSRSPVTPHIRSRRIRAILADLGVGRQWELQGRLDNAESVSLELFKTALQLARHRGLLDPSTPDSADRRHEFAEEVANALRRIDVIRDLARPVQTSR